MSYANDSESQSINLNPQSSFVVDLILERFCREHPFVMFGQLAKSLRIIDGNELVDLIESATDEGVLNDHERDDLFLLDAIAKGKDKNSGSDLYLAVEASSVADEHDLERALRRAQLLTKATGTAALPVIASDIAAKGILALAESRGVYWVSRG